MNLNDISTVGKKEMNESIASFTKTFYFDILVLGDTKSGKKTFMRQFRTPNNQGYRIDAPIVEMVEKSVQMPGHSG